MSASGALLFDSHDAAAEAAESGAVVIVAERPVEVPEGICVVLVKDTRYALALISAAYFGYPARKLKVIGITGTKGKTTTTFHDPFHSGACGNPHGPYRNHRDDYRRPAYPGQQYDAGILHDSGVFRGHGGSGLPGGGHGGVLPGPEASPDGGNSV